MTLAYFVDMIVLKISISKILPVTGRFIMLRVFALVILTIILTGFLYSKVFKRFHLSAEGSQRDFLVSLMIGLFASYYLIYQIL